MKSNYQGGYDFLEIVEGTSQQPKKDYQISEVYSEKYGEIFHQYLRNYISNFTPFWRHFCSSIPYIAEEHVRWAFALSSIAENGLKTQLYAPEDADANDVRTLLESFPEKFESIVNYGTIESCKTKILECARSGHDISAIGGCYIDLPFEHLKANTSIADDGFDIIIVNVALQFNHLTRIEQLLFLKSMMKDDGIIIILEKFKGNNYFSWLFNEFIKDYFYKRKYFSSKQLKWKKEKILNTMTNNLVTRDEMKFALNSAFKFSNEIWRIGNFSTFVSCDNESKLNRFSSKLVEPYYPGIWKAIDWMKS